MTTEADIGHGTQFQTGNGATPEVFATLAEVVNITPPGIKRDSVDASHGQSPDEMREFIAGLKDGGECSMEMNFVPGGPAAAALMAEFALIRSQATKNRRVVFPDGTIWAFAAFLTGFEPEAPNEDKMTATVTFKVTGAVAVS